MDVYTEPDGGFYGEVPAVPGCEARGKTVDECMWRLGRELRRRVVRHLEHTARMHDYSKDKGGVPSDDLVPSHLKDVRRGRFDLPEIPDDTMDKLASYQKEKREMAQTNDRILLELGLPDGASESEVYQAVKDIKDRLAAAEERLLEIEATEFVDANMERISDADSFKELYKTHGREVAEAFLGAVK